VEKINVAFSLSLLTHYVRKLRVNSCGAARAMF